MAAEGSCGVCAQAVGRCLQKRLLSCKAPAIGGCSLGKRLVASAGVCAADVLELWCAR
jgi:hypothetical protein